MSDELIKSPAAAEADERKKLFAEAKAQLSEIYLSSAENFDKAILTYSVAALGFSLAFLKDFVPIHQAVRPWLLYASWAMFVASMISTMCTFLLSQEAVAKQLRLYEQYYLHRNDAALSQGNWLSEFTGVLNYFSAFAFVGAIVCTTVFVGLNLEPAGKLAEQKKAAPAASK